jgi:hypothetical protein
METRSWNGWGNRLTARRYQQVGAASCDDQVVQLIRAESRELLTTCGYRAMRTAGAS